MKKLTMNSKEKIEAVLALENADRDPLALAVKYISKGYEEFKENRKIPRKKIFVEVGGYKGKTVDKVLKRDSYSKIYVLEPNPQLYDFLMKKYSEKPNVVVLPVALWNENGIKPFFISELNDGSSLHGEKRNLRKPKEIYVTCKRATDFIKSLDDDVFLYLNCEGAEFEILEDLIKSDAYQKIKKLEIAFHHQRSRLDCRERHKDLIALMKDKKIKFKEVDKLSSIFVHFCQVYDKFRAKQKTN